MRVDCKGNKTGVGKRLKALFDDTFDLERSGARAMIRKAKRKGANRNQVENMDKDTQLLQSLSTGQ